MPNSFYLFSTENIKLLFIRLSVFSLQEHGNYSEGAGEQVPLPWKGLQNNFTCIDKTNCEFYVYYYMYGHQTVLYLSMCLLSAKDDLCKQFGPRSGPTEPVCHSDSVPEIFFKKK